MKKKTKKILLSLSALTVLLFLTGCSKAGLTSDTPGIWNQIVYHFALVIRWLGFGGSIAVGIILFTLLLRLLMFPLMNIQIKSMQKQQELQPQIKAIQAKYPGKDMDSRQMVQQETQKLYSDNGVNMYMGCLPMLVQMPFLYALYQALLNVNFLHQGNFLWFDIGAKDPTLILPILAALFTFASSWLNLKAAPERTGMLYGTTIGMPIFIFFAAWQLSAGISLYWVISNAFQVVQTLIIANPWKIIAKREAKVQAVVDKEKARARALKKATKK
ncbi:MAG: YidC/Oxa1 family membrane protein insertase [Streptococcaceae bacterium]|jgi:YidC/Oxa1 family membrane protein insertase|nr:YidC/Oxa1 family membrane protein insertase [Streptococcaceae bacterium]